MVNTFTMPRLGDPFPDYDLKTTIGDIKLHNWMGDSWAVLFSHPADFTPVCTTELAEVAKLMPEFKKRNVKVIGLSCDPVKSHHEWAKDVMHYGTLTGELPYPLIADEDRRLANELGMIDPNEVDAAGIAMTARAVFVIGPDKKMKLSFLYPATTGRNYNELLRVIDSLQLTARCKVATPVNWEVGDNCMVLPTVSDKDANDQFPKGVTAVPVPSGKPYLRHTPHP